MRSSFAIRFRWKGCFGSLGGELNNNLGVGVDFKFVYSNTFDCGSSMCKVQSAKCKVCERTYCAQHSVLSTDGHCLPAQVV